MEFRLKDLAKLSWYYQLLIVSAVCAGLLALVWYQFLDPMKTEIVVKTAQMDELQRTIAKSLAQQKELLALKQETIALQLKLDMLKAVLPLEKETDQIFRSVQQLAMLSGLRVQRVAPRSTVDHEVYTEYPIDLDVIGTYHNVGAFLDRIRQLPRIVNINGLKLQSRASEGELALSSSVGATYTATTFVYKDEPALAEATAGK